MNLLEDLDYRRETANRHRQNSARLAHAYARATSTGQGSFEFDQRVDFGLTFIEEPVIAYGCSVDADTLADLQGLQEGQTPILPTCTGYVTEWDTDDRDFYVGCWIGVRVHFPREDFPPTEIPEGVISLAGYMPEVNETMNQAVIRHFYTFSAVAMKDVPTEVSD